MQFVPAAKPRSAWRALILFFAALLTFGVLVPVTASAHGTPLLRVKDSAVMEPHVGYRLAHVKITLNHPTHHTVSVGWYTKSLRPGGMLKAATAWKDYKPASGRAYIAKGHLSTFVHVKVFADKKVEGNEYFKVKLVHPHGAMIADRVGLVKIIDNPPEPVLPTLYVHSVTTDEGGVPHFKVVLSKPAVADVTFHFTTLDDTAVDTQAENKAALVPAQTATAADYMAKSGDRTIPKGSTTAFIGVTTNKDGLTEPAEDFLLKVSNVVHATVHNSTGEATITANSS